MQLVPALQNLMGVYSPALLAKFNSQFTHQGGCEVQALNKFFRLELGLLPHSSKTDPRFHLCDNISENQWLDNFDKYIVSHLLTHWLIDFGGE